MIRECEICGGPLTTYPSRIARGCGRYCSQKCTGIAHSVTRKGYKHTEETKEKMSKSAKNRWKGHPCSRTQSRVKYVPRVEKPCEQCGNLTKNKRFCSNKCKGLAMRGTYPVHGPQRSTHKTMRKVGRAAIICKSCGNCFVVNRSRVGTAKYCSPECNYKVMGERQKGENNPYWKGGITPLHTAIRMSKEYAEWRDAVFARDNWTCQDCGGKISGNLNAHHIFSFRDFPEHRLAVWNGITLCQNCHQKSHPGMKLHRRKGVVP